MRTTLLLAGLALFAMPAFAQVDALDLGSPGAIPDDAYDGTLASMTCASVDNSGGTVVDITGVELDMAVTHTWVGDLTIKVASPNGTILTVLQRPGDVGDLPDDGTGCCGSGTDWLGASINFNDTSANSANDMGSLDDPVGSVVTDYAPTPELGPGTDFSDFNTEDATTGSWEVCIGDAVAADTGTFDGGTLTITGLVPVELVSFDALVNGTDLRLEWATASETNNAGFEVQMQDGENWNVLSFVDGHGTTSEAQTYGFDVGEMAVGSHTFRLKQIDYDGTFEYSGELEVSIETPGTHALSNAYPNPFNPQSQFTLSVAQEQLVTAELYNTLGQRVATLFNGTVEANQTQNVTIDGTGLASGLYIVRVNGESFSDALQVTLLK